MATMHTLSPSALECSGRAIRTPGRAEGTSVMSRLLGAAAVACLGAASSALAGTSLFVENSGFESPSYPLCGFSTATAWVATGSGGAWHPGSQTQCGTYFGGPIPEGSQIGFVNGTNNHLSQVLSSTLQPFTKYELIVEVGKRADGFGTGSYRTELRAGGIALVEDPGMLEIPLGTFQTSVICFETRGSHAAMGQPLEIRLYANGGQQANFDDVRLFASDPDGICETVSSNPADLDGNGVVDGGDLGLLLGSWGSCANCAACPADLDGNCTVDGADLGLLLGSWG